MRTARSSDRYPREVPAGSARAGQSYVRAPDYYAVHDRDPESPAPGAEVVLGDGEVAVFRGRVGKEKPTGTVGPVYSLNGSGPPAVPTGMLFVRFTEGVQADAKRKEIEGAGYELVSSPSYAPHSAWVRARSGDLAEALANVSQLESLPDVENVEPQMLMEAAQR